MSASPHHRFLRGFVALAAILGFGIMTYLTYLHYAKTESFCNFSEKVSCDTVTQSIYGEIFGIPISLLGLLYFLAIGFSLLRNPSLKTYRFIFFATILALIPALYLTLTEIIFIRAACILCETSKFLMVGILAASWMMIRKQSEHLLRTAMPLIITGFVAAVIAYLIQTGTIIPQDHSGLAQHLNAQGWVYYRSYTCANCKRQEKLLGNAYQFLPSVECHPRGPGGNPELCLQKNITKTPTWILEQDGKEVLRLEGVQTIETLTQTSHYAP